MKYIILAGPQAAGKSTTIRYLKKKSKRKLEESFYSLSRTLGINSGACLGFLNTPKIVFAFSRVKTGSLRKKQFLLY